MRNTKSSVLKIGNKLVGDGQPIFIMADVGLTNGGDLTRAKELISIAAEAGADAIKFQMIGPDVLLGDKSVEYSYTTLEGKKITENMYEMFSKLSYTEEQWSELFEYSRNKGLEFICTAHYSGAVDILERLGVTIHKICTWSSTHKRLIQKIGNTGKPLMLDTGMVSTKSLAELLGWHSEAGGRGAFILHDFHTKDIGEMNFNSIPFMKEYFGLPVGYTPQGRDDAHDILSVGLGVNILEKRLTTDCKLEENGHFKALEPKEFSTWLQKIRKMEDSMGMYSVLPTKQDMEESKKYYKSLYAKKEIFAGAKISDEMLESRRPGTGISSQRVDEICGRVAARDIKEGQMLSMLDLN